MGAVIQIENNIYSTITLVTLASASACTRGGGASPCAGTSSPRPRAAPQLLAPPPAAPSQHWSPAVQPIQHALEAEHAPVLCTVHGCQALHGLPQQRCRRGKVNHSAQQNAQVSRSSKGVRVLAAKYAVVGLQRRSAQRERRIVVPHLRVHTSEAAGADRVDLIAAQRAALAVQGLLYQRQRGGTVAHIPMHHCEVVHRAQRLRVVIAHGGARPATPIPAAAPPHDLSSRRAQLPGGPSRAACTRPRPRTRAAR